MKIVHSLIAGVLVLFSTFSFAELKVLNDDVLSNHVGQINQLDSNNSTPFQAPLSLNESSIQDSQTLSFTAQPPAKISGITMDIDLQFHIDEIRWVDVDGAGVNGRQGAIVMKNFSVGHLDGPIAKPAQIRGVTVGVDGRDGLVVGVEQIGDRFGNGIYVNIDSLQIK